MRISVVVPSYNSSRTIRACLESLLAQERPADEIILVDSSEDDTPLIVGREFPGVRLIHLPERTLPGPARNLGVERACGELVALIDSDCVALPHWLAEIARAFEDEDLHAVVGTVGGPAGEHWVAALDRLQFTEYLPTSPPRWARVAPTCNLAVRRDAYRRVGGCPDLPRAQDTVFTAKLTGQFGPARLVPRATVLHLSPEDRGAYLRRQYRAGRGFADSRLHDPSLAGSAAARLPWLVPLLAAVKGARQLWRLLRYDRKLLMTVLAHFPTFLAGMWLWSVGAYQGFRQARGRARPGDGARP